MCNLYSITKGQAAILEFTRAMRDRTGNLPPMPGIFPDQPAPIVRTVEGERELSLVPWGMPTSSQELFGKAKLRAEKLEAKGKPVDFSALLRAEPDSGTTNVRNTASKHWLRWLGPQNRCLVPFTSFSEYDAVTKVPIWFAGNESRPLMVFAGIWKTWTSVRKVKEGEITTDLFGFLTTEPNPTVAAVHPKAMPVILTTAEDAGGMVGGESLAAATAGGRSGDRRARQQKGPQRMIYRIAEYIDRVERERPQLYRFMTSIWPLLGLAIIAALGAWTFGLIG